MITLQIKCAASSLNKPTPGKYLGSKIAKIFNGDSLEKCQVIIFPA
jgi:hypothetical protein